METLTEKNLIKSHDFFGKEFSNFFPNWPGNLSDQYNIESNTVSSGVNDIIVFLKNYGVIINYDNDLITFLMKNYSLITHLYDIPEKIHNVFGKVIIEIEVLQDSDNFETGVELYVEIATKLTPLEANKYLDKLVGDWIIKSQDKDLLFLNLTLKFI